MTSPALTQLRHLRRLGFDYEPVLDATGRLDFAYFSRTVHGRLEAVLVRGEHDALGYRCRPGPDPDNPLRLDPAAIDRLVPPGDVVKVVHALLAEPGTDRGLR